MTNYSPLSSERAGGEALFVPHHFTINNQSHHRPQSPLKQPPPFPRLTTPLPLRGGVGGEALFASTHPTLHSKTKHTIKVFDKQTDFHTF